MATVTENRRASSILPLFNSDKRRPDTSGVESGTPERTKNANSLRNRMTLISSLLFPYADIAVKTWLLQSANLSVRILG